ncbi:MAG: Secretion system C-terminal sorting domain [Bacteroidota bacterium]|jgi:hypothetical protein
MKKVVLLFFLFIGLKSNAQIQYYSSKLNGSLPLLSECRKVVEFNGERYFLISSSVYKYDSTNNSLVFWQYPYQNQSVIDIGVDSSNNFIIYNDYNYSGNYFIGVNFYNGNSWVQKKYYQDYHFSMLSFIVDSSNRIYSVSQDSLFSFKNNVWNKSKCIFSNPNEKCYRLIPGSNHEPMLVTSYYFSNNPNLFANIYKVIGTNLVLIKGGIPFTYKFQYDRNNNLWYSYLDTVFKISPTNVVTKFDNSNSPYISKWALFAINQAGTKLWRRNSFYNGNTWVKFSNDTTSIFIDCINNDELFSSNKNSINEFRDSSHIRTYYKTNRKIVSPNCIQNFDFNQEYSLLGQNIFLSAIGSKAGVNLMSIPWGYDCLNYNRNNLPQLPSDTILSIKLFSNVEGSIDTFCLGTNHGFCLFELNKSGEASVFNLLNKSNNKLLSDTVNSVFVYPPERSWYTNKSKTIWVGTNNGVAKFNSDFSSVKYYTTSNSNLPSNHIQKITSSYDDSIIIFCTDSGFSTLYGNIMQTYTTTNSGLSNNDVRDVGAKGSINNYYYEIATMGGGICIDSMNSWRTLSKKNGNYISDSINFINGKQVSSFCGEITKVIACRDTGFEVIDNINSAPRFFNSLYNSSAFNQIDYSLIGSQQLAFVYSSISNNMIVFAYGCTEGIQNFDSKNNDDFYTYLNSNTLNIRWNKLKEGNATIQLYDVLGRKVFEKNVFASDNFCNAEIPELISALYFVKVQQKEKSHAGKISFVK